MISPTQLSVIAKASVKQELAILNEALSNGTTDVEGYSSGKIGKLLKSNIRKISLDFAYNKCIFDSENIQTLLSDELSLNHDELIARSTNLESLRDAYGSRIWKLISQLCVNSKIRFEHRLQNISADGKKLNIDQKTSEKISKIFFYPTFIGKPSLKKSLIRTLYATIDAAYTIGSIQSLAGILVGDIIVSLAFISQSMMNFMIVDLAPLKNELLEMQLDFNEYERVVLQEP